MLKIKLKNLENESEVYRHVRMALFCGQNDDLLKLTFDDGSIKVFNFKQYKCVYQEEERDDGREQERGRN